MPRTVLGSLASVLNVGGEEALSRRVPRERTHVERQTIRMYERKQETWRPLNRDRVVAFLELFLLAMLRVENARRLGHQPRVTATMLKKALVKRVIPWINRNRVWTRDESQSPVTLEHFKELDSYLVVHLPRARSDYRWHNIITFFKEVEREREVWKRLDELERDAMEAYEQRMANLNN